MDPSHPTASAIAVRGDRIRAIGSVEELAAYPGARIDDRYRDSVLFPGMVEAHSHVMSGAMWTYQYVGFYERMSPDGQSWPGCPDVDSVLDRLRAAERSLPDPKAPLIAWGFDPLFLGGERLDRTRLDTVSQDRPIVLLHQSNHALTTNSVSLREAGIHHGSDAEGVVLDSNGDPTGELREFPAMGLVGGFRAIMTRPEFDEVGLRNFADDARNHGVTSAVDLGNRSLMNDQSVNSFAELIDGPDFSLRLSLFHLAGFADSPSPEAAIHRLSEITKRSSAKTRFGHVKIILDGSIQGFTARLQPPGYLQSDRVGLWAMAPAEFATIFEEFHRAGHMVHVHCNGDEATEVFLDAVEAAMSRYPRPDHRHNVTHSQLSTPAQYRRMAKLGMCANLFINHLWYWGDQHADLTVGPDRAARMNAAATALREGVPIALHSDTPITPLDPLASASIACLRTTATGRVLGAHERIDVPQALRAVTLGAAYQLKMDHEVGSLEPGKFADLAVLDRDPYDVEPDELRSVQVRGTVVGGSHFPRAT